jgi:hypothetical protein
MSIKSALAAIAVLATSTVAHADTLPCQPSGGAWSRGHCSYVHSRNPEGWVRGSASVARDTGIVTMKLQLETDSTTHGPCGRMSVILRDTSGADLATLKVEEKVCRGGKSPGRAERSDFTFQKAVPLAVAEKTTQVIVLTEKAGRHFGFWGIPLSVIEDAIKLFVAAGE